MKNKEYHNKKSDNSNNISIFKYLIQCESAFLFEGKDESYQ